MITQTQQARNVIGWVLGIAAFSPLALCHDSLIPRVTLSDVTGRVTYCGRPLTGATIALHPESGNHTAIGILGSDGSFRLRSMKEARVGAQPGLYHAYLYSRKGDMSLPAKFRDPRTSGVEIEIVSGWNDLSIDLR